MKRQHPMSLAAIAVTGFMWLLMRHTSCAQEPNPVDDAPVQAAADAGQNVTPESVLADQMAVSGRYDRFERMLTQMADILGRQDPERADLLRRAIGKGREGRIKEQIEGVIKLIDSRDLGIASEKQADVIRSLQAMLKLLQSEDRRSAVERERDRLNGLLKDVRNVMAEQRSARAATQNSPAPSSAAPGQKKAISETDKLLDAMREHDDKDGSGDKKGEDKEASDKDGADKKEAGQDSKDGSKDGKQSEPKEGDPAGKEKEGTEKDPKEGDPKEGDPKQGDSKQSDKKAEGEPEKGEPAPSDPQSGEPKSGEQKSGGKSSGDKKSDKQQKQQTPGREQLEKAREEMERALDKLKEQKREDAIENEDKAIEALHKAAEKLEAMLRQLREEEKEMMLASLEARFQRMLLAETAIHEGTIGVAATPQKDWLDLNYGRCRELSQQQSELTQECAQTVNLLQEDGTSVAIVIAVEDIQADMSSVTGWMQEYKVGELTQSVQKDILESLKQLIETTQKEMQEMKEQQKQEQQQQDPSQEKEGLVELMAEIRVLRSLQLRVNRRTKQVDRLLQSANTDDLPTLRSQLHDLAIRQNRLIESAKELAKQAQ